MLSGICPPVIRRDVCDTMEGQLQSTIETHSLFGQIPPTKRLKSRHGFLSSVQPANFPAKVIICSEWRRRLRNNRTQALLSFTKRWQGLRQSMDHVEILEPSEHGVYMQQDTEKEVEVILWKSRRNQGTHVTVFLTCTSMLFG